MRVVIQKAIKASVSANNKVTGVIDQGLMVLVGVEDLDTQDDADWLANKIVNMRLFADENEVNNLSVKDVNGGILVVSQFTLHASTKKGNRPSYMRAGKPDHAKSMYEYLVKKLSEFLEKEIPTGVFGEMMEVSLVNLGPMTMVMDSKNKE
ncbi:MAG: D-tyrosyl-tRNA(Tyr) deacylase [Sphingobacteriales bacterium]|jgi:D-tyrosyl-tRNA(Tyr) deacylase